MLYHLTVDRATTKEPVSSTPSQPFITFPLGQDMCHIGLLVSCQKITEHSAGLEKDLERTFGRTFLIHLLACAGDLYAKKTKTLLSQLKYMLR